MKMLICEDEIGVVKILKRYLKYKGHDADHALNGRIALKKKKKQDYGIVFLDINMPELTGIEVLKDMKNNHYKAKVIILTGYPGVTSDFCASLGADRYLEKPVDLKVIGEIIDEYTR
ncbi:MAG: response regulator [Candidatus Omnitrophica bacterium]|nr:response regulator [Candidatus Omnitrophota bacterium]